MKKFIGWTCHYVGLPWLYSVANVLVPATAANKDTFLIDKRVWLWAIPASIVLLPLAPFSLIGESILDKLENEEFAKSTVGLPVLDNVPDKYAVIWDPKEERTSGLWAVELVDQKDFLDGDIIEFANEQECIDYLVNAGYHKVVLKDRMFTFWVIK